MDTLKSTQSMNERLTGCVLDVDVCIGQACIYEASVSIVYFVSTFTVYLFQDCHWLSSGWLVPLVENFLEIHWEQISLTPIIILGIFEFFLLF